MTLNVVHWRYLTHTLQCNHQSTHRLDSFFTNIIERRSLFHHDLKSLTRMLDYLLVVHKSISIHLLLKPTHVFAADLHCFRIKICIA